MIVQADNGRLNLRLPASAGHFYVAARLLEVVRAARNDLVLWFPADEPQDGYELAKLLGYECALLPGLTSREVMRWAQEPLVLPEGPGWVYVHAGQTLREGTSLREWCPQYGLGYPEPPVDREDKSPGILIVPGQDGRKTDPAPWIELVRWVAFRTQGLMPVRVAGTFQETPLLAAINAAVPEVECYPGQTVAQLLDRAAQGTSVICGYGAAYLLSVRKPTTLIMPTKLRAAWVPDERQSITVIPYADFRRGVGAIASRLRGKVPRRIRQRTTTPQPTGFAPERPRATGANPWVPVELPVLVKNRVGRGVRVIIPTAAQDVVRLETCLKALEAASHGHEVKTVLVVCPTDDEARAKAALVKRDRAHVDLVFLPGPFNFCQSINAGLKLVQGGEEYVLFLNDDCLMPENGIAHLIDTLETHHWAAVGPWVQQTDAHEWEGHRIDGVRRLNMPLVGSCVLWQRQWLDRLGGLDEQFGIGWGLDESDLSLRALRHGALWGRDERLRAVHLSHSTFGWDYTRKTGPAHLESLGRFHAKFGEEVDSWGNSPHWHPLPGVHVALAGHNVVEWIERALFSVAESLKGFRWVLTYADDASTDGSANLVEQWARHLGAVDVRVQRFPKAQTVAQAKNRAVEMGREFQPYFPALMLMDADDEMLPQRALENLWRTRDGGHLVTHGTYQTVSIHPEFQHRNGHVIYPNGVNQQFEGWLHPGSTIIHWSLVPADGKLFPEHIPICEDAYLWLEWWAKGIKSEPLPGPPSYLYHLRLGSLMHDAGSKWKMEVFRAARAQLLRTTGLDPHAIYIPGAYTPPGTYAP